MKYTWIEKNVVCWPVRTQCRVLAVSVSDYHQHHARREDPPQAASQADGADGGDPGCGPGDARGVRMAPRVATTEGTGRSRGQAARATCDATGGHPARGKRRFRSCTTNSSHPLPVAPNLLDRNFTVQRSNAVWAGDITYIPTRQGWLYLATVLDLFSRRIVGWSMSEEMTATIAIDALEMAWHSRSPGREAGLIFHSDRGSEYVSAAFTTRLRKFGMQASMSRKGNCWDNACAETLFGSLKVKRLHGMDLHTHREAKDATLEWLLWYNGSRMHSTLGYLSPAQFERQANAQLNALAA